MIRSSHALLSRWLVLLATTLSLTACGFGQDGDGVIGTGFTVNGNAEKGPFTVNSNITVNLLNKDGTSKTQTLNTQIKDDLGSFSFSLPTAGGIQITANGYHFNEISGNLSDGPLTLYAVYDAIEDEKQSAYVNVLTHLIHSRALNLMKEGKATTDAINQAQKELITALLPVLPVTKLPDFTRLRVYNTDDTVSDGNAYLLALSATIYQFATSQAQLSDESESAELSLVLNDMAIDLSNDGLLNSDPSLVSNLVGASRLIDPALVEKNLKLRSMRVIQAQLAVPNINLFLDTDGDGIANQDDTDDDNDGIPDVKDKNPYLRGELGITIVQPAPDSGSASRKLRAVVSDDTLIEKIEYLIDGEKIGESSKAPFEVTWDPYFWSETTATYSLMTRITDVAGNKQLGPIIQLSVPPIAAAYFSVTQGKNSVVRDSDSINLAWIATAPAAKYEIELRNADYPYAVVNTQITTVPSHTTQNLAQGKYSWRLRAANSYDNWGAWSELFQFTITGPVPPVFMSPMSGSTIGNTDTPTIIWQIAALATGYQIQLANNAAFTPALMSSELTDTSITSSALTQGQYYVRLRSKNSLQYWGEWSEVTTFTVTGPGAPTLVSPADKATVATLVDVPFSWNPSTYAIQYVFQLSKSATFATIDAEIESTETTVSQKLTIGQYYWRVRAKNSTGFFGDWSATNSASAGTFTKSYGGPKTDYPLAGKETKDGGYIIVGYTESGTVRNGAIYLLKISANGTKEWDQTFDTAERDSGLDANELANGNFILVGNSGEKEPWLIEIDKAGQKLHERFIKNETFGGLLALDDGYVLGTNLLVSEKTVNGSTYFQYVPKVTRYGLSQTELWSHTFDESITDFESIQSVEIDGEGNILVAGAYDPTPAEVTDPMQNEAYIYTLSKFGDTHSYVKLANFFLGSYTISIRPLSGGLYFVKLNSVSEYFLYNSLGKKLWSTKSGVIYSTAALMLSGANGHIDAVEYGGRYMNGALNFGTYRLVYDLDGYSISDTQLTNEGTDLDRGVRNRQIIATLDGGYMLLSNQTVSGNTDILVTKIDSNGDIGK